MNFRKKTVATAAILLLLTGISGLTVLAQEKKVDAAKLYSEIAGDYEFSFGEQHMILSFWEDNGKLYGAPKEQEAESAEILPVDLEGLKFEASAPNGQYYEIGFGKDENGKIVKCTLTTQGTVIEGLRMKK